MSDGSGAPHRSKHLKEKMTPENFWVQVKRTVNGQPVSQDQIDLIVSTMTAALDLGRDDVLLDLGCGNGALTTYFFRRCRGGLGVDFSEFLIGVARSNFSSRPEHRYFLSDIVDYVARADETEGYTKALCYGVFQYLSPDGARSLLFGLRRRFTGVGRLVLGNIPNKDAISAFYSDGVPDGVSDRADSPIGIWRTQEELSALAEVEGWRVTFQTMPAAYHAAHYRYDAILVPK